MTPTAASMLSLPLVLPMPRMRNARAPCIRRRGVRPGARWREIGDRERAVAIDLRAADHRDRHRHVLHALRAVARRDDELLDRLPPPRRPRASACSRFLLRVRPGRRVSRPDRRPRPDVDAEPTVYASALRLTFQNPCSLHAPSSSVCAPAIHKLRRRRHARYRRVSDGAVSTWFYFHHVLAVRRSTFSIETELSLRGDLFFTAVLVTCVNDKVGRLVVRKIGTDAAKEPAQPPRVLIAGFGSRRASANEPGASSAPASTSPLPATPSARDDAARGPALRFACARFDDVRRRWLSRPPPRFVAGCAHRSSSRVRAEQKPTSYAH